MSKSKNRVLNNRAQNVDLFGEPIPEKRPRGRPRHKPTKASRRKVTMMRRRRARAWQIALELGITLPTLRLHYPVRP